MKKFRFKLESVLRARVIGENEALKNLAEAQKKLQSELENKKTLQLQLDQALDEREGLGEVPVPATGFQILHNHIIGTKQRILRSDQAIVRANRNVQKAMRSYLHAKRLTRMMEIMRERAFSEFRLLRKKEEQKVQDDLTIMRSRMSASEEGSDQ